MSRPKLLAKKQKIEKFPTITYQGWLSHLDTNEGFYLPVLDDGFGNNISLFHRFEELGLFYNCFSVRYGYANIPGTLNDIQLSFELGDRFADFYFRKEVIHGHYSEMTPYEDYNVEMKIGGHDLYKEIMNVAYTNQAGKKVWFVIEITPGIKK